MVEAAGSRKACLKLRTAGESKRSHDDGEYCALVLMLMKNVVGGANDVLPGASARTDGQLRVPPSPW